MIDRLWNQAVNILEQDWPSRLQGWIESDDASVAIADKARKAADPNVDWDACAAYDVRDYWSDPGMINPVVPSYTH